MELLTSFTDEEVLTNDMPLHWMMITPSRPSESVEPEAMQEQSHSRSQRAYPWGSFLVTHSMR